MELIWVMQVRLRRVAVHQAAEVAQVEMPVTQGHPQEIRVEVVQAEVVQADRPVEEPLREALKLQAETKTSPEAVCPSVRIRLVKQ